MGSNNKCPEDYKCPKMYEAKREILNLWGATETQHKKS